jgi:L-ribulose-5-phosphate 4-epimerase
MKGCDPLGCPAILVAGHGPFAWGRTVTDAAHNAVIVEEIAAMALQTITANVRAKPLEKVLHEKHFFRKHGSTAYYGQKKGS